MHIDIKGGPYWTWTRRLDHGCADWTAKDQWASVELRMDSQCNGQRDLRRLTARGVTYLSVEDHLVFANYWPPWTDEQYSDLIVFDRDGMISEILPCPYALSSEQISAMRVLAQQAFAEATTDAERRVLARIEERIAAVNGTSLASGQSGCTDLPPDWYGASISRQDPWTPR